MLLTRHLPPPNQINSSLKNDVCSSKLQVNPFLNFNLLECRSGYFGLNCSSKCPENYYGRHCSERCDCPEHYYCDHNCGCEPHTKLLNHTKSERCNSNGSMKNQENVTGMNKYLLSFRKRYFRFYLKNKEPVFDTYRNIN